MRFNEVASAAEQMALWRLISDNVWAAVEQQSRDEQKRKAAERAKPKVKGAAKGVAKAVAQPRVSPPVKAAAPSQPVPSVRQSAATASQGAAVSATGIPSINAKPMSTVGSLNSLKRTVNAVSGATDRLPKSDDDIDDRYS